MSPRKGLPISAYDPSFSQSLKPPNVVQTIGRAASILNILGQSPHGITLRDLSARVNLPKGTTHRLLSSLVHFGFAQQDSENKKYSLGFKLVDLGHRLLSQLDFRNVAKPFLLDMAERTQETVHLVVLDQNEVVYIEKVESHDHRGGLRMASRIGLRNPAHSCAVGKVLLAHLPARRFEAVIRERGLVRRTKKTITHLKRLEEQLQSVRAQGFAIDDEENEEGIRCVAAPIRDETGWVIAAVSISGPAIRMSLELIQRRLQREVMDTALKISKKLGFRGERHRG